MIKRNDNNSKLEKLYYTYRSLMYTEAYRILSDRSLSEDAVNESFIRIVNHLHKLKSDDCPQTRNFLVVVCRNVAKDIYSQRNKEVFLCPDEADVFFNSSLTPEDIIINKENYTKLRDIISTLDPKYKDLLVLSSVYKLKYSDIATITGLSVDAVSKRVQRARQKIKEQLRTEGK